MIKRVEKLTSRINLSCLGHDFDILVKHDCKGGDRVFIQLTYSSICVKTGEVENWKARKHYLSEHMSDDEIVKTVYIAFELCIKHEILEGFKVDGKILFNPHINFEELLDISHKEVVREENLTEA